MLFLAEGPSRHRLLDTRTSGERLRGTAYHDSFSASSMVLRWGSTCELDPALWPFGCRFSFRFFSSSFRFFEFYKIDPTALHSRSRFSAFVTNDGMVGNFDFPSVRSFL